jgi:hypothetical protein
MLPLSCISIRAHLVQRRAHVGHSGRPRSELSISLSSDPRIRPRLVLSEDVSLRHTNRLLYQPRIDELTSIIFARMPSVASISLVLHAGALILIYSVYSLLQEKIMKTTYGTFSAYH